MTKTKSLGNINQRRLEKRHSRLKQTKQYVLSISISGLLNNQKWYNLFDWLESNKNEFELRILLTGEKRNCDWIRELEKTSILIDETGDFIEFYEIERIKTNNIKELVDFLDSSNIEYSTIQEEIEIYGYRK